MRIWLAVIGAVAALALSAAGGAWLTHTHWRAKWAEAKTVQAQAERDAAADALTSASRLAALEHTHDEIARLEHEKESALAAAVDAGRVRLHVNATCPRVPETADAGVGDAARPELAAAARPDYHALRSGLIEMRAELDKCRAAVRELTTTPPPTR